MSSSDSGSIVHTVRPSKITLETIAAYTTSTTATTFQSQFDENIFELKKNDVKDTSTFNRPSSEAKSSDPIYSKNGSPPLQIVWKNVVMYTFLYIASLFGVYLMFTSAMWQTNVFAFFLYVISILGVTAGAHRLWSHRSYKAKLPLRILLAFLFTVAFQGNIYIFARDHRVHHKYSETDADPHNAKRGFFFAHVGWLLCRKHPEVTKKGKGIDTSDLLADPVVLFHKKYYLRLVLIFCFILPTLIPLYLWGETLLNSFFVATILRYCFTLNQTFFGNSAAHLWGQRPYDDSINPAENILVVFGTIGEGFHNYHHTFPYDYATSEYGMKYNITTAFIDLLAWLGLAYDRKTASRDVIAARRLRTGQDKIILVKQNDRKEDENMRLKVK